MSGNRHQRPASRERKILGPPANEAWMWITRAMLESPAWRQITPAGRKILDRLCIEHMAHAGRENGRLAVGYDDFEAMGVDRGLIRRTLMELDGLGFVRCVQRGRRGWGDGTARLSCYRLTFFGVVGSNDQAKATNEWQAHTTEHRAEEAVKAARAALPARRKTSTPKI